MATPSGLAGQVGYAQETTVGTGVTVTRFLPFISESIVSTRDRLESAAIIAGRSVITSNQWNGGNNTFGGDIQHELYRSGIGLLWTNALGAVATTGAGPYVHTFTPGTLTGKSLTVQVGRPDISGTVRPFTYAGSKITKWAVSCKAGEIASFAATFVAMSETTATALASSTFPTTAGRPFKFNHGTASIGGSAVNCRSFTLNGDNVLDEGRRFLGTQAIAEPLESGLRVYSGTMELEFADLTQYNRWTAGTEVAIVFTFTAGADVMTFTMNARIDGESPSVTGPGILLQQIPFKAIATPAGADSTALTVVYTTSDPTPT